MRFAVLVVSTLFAVGLLGPAASAAELRQGQVQLSQSSPGTPTSRLVARGDDLMAIGDISAARLLYETAASQGDAVAAAKLGMTYDPIELSAKGVVGMVGDPETAAKWYRLAVDRGYNPAASSLAALAMLFWKVWGLQTGRRPVGYWLRGLKDGLGRRSKAQGTTKQS